MGVNGHRHEDRLANRREFQALFFDDIVEIRLVLIGVHVEILFSQCFVGLYIIVEFDDFDGNPLFGSFFDDFVHDFCMRTSRNPYFNFFFCLVAFAVIAGTAAGSKYTDGCNEAGGNDFFNR